MNYENRKISALHELWNIKMFICNTWIMKTGKYLLYMNMKTLKYLFAIHELWKQENICLHELWKH